MQVWLFSFFLFGVLAQPVNFTLQNASLCAFAQALSIPGWTCAASNAACTSAGWTGLRCDVAGKVTQINLIGLGLIGTIPTEIGWLAALQVFNIGNNNINGPLISEIGMLSQLAELVVYTNRLQGPLGTWIGKNMLLTNLVLSDNAFTGPVPTQIGRLILVTNADFSRNQFSLFPTELGLMLPLKDLDLGYNLLSSLPTEIGLLTQLTSLDIEHNSVTTLPAQLGNLNKLNNLNLNNNLLTSTLPIGIFSLFTLTNLDFHDNYITSIPSVIGMLASLRNFVADHNLINSTIPSDIGRLSNLRLLHLNLNQISGSIPTELGDLVLVNNMDLSSNKLSGPIPSQLGSMISLQVLSLDTNFLNGTLPPTLSALVQLSVLTLSSNFLTGPFPPSLSRLLSLTRFTAGASVYFDCWPFGYTISTCALSGVIGYNCPCSMPYQPSCAMTVINSCPITTSVPSSAPTSIPTVGPTAPTEVPTLGPTAVPSLATGSPISVPTSPTTSVCGNGLLEAPEQCDDGNSVSGDGCSSCAIDYGYVCTGTAPSVCTFCFGPWVPVSVGLSPLCSACDNGTLLLARVVSSYCSSTYSSYAAYNCSFPCLASSTQANFTSIVSFLDNNSYLQNLLQNINLTVQVVAREIDSNTISVSFVPCTNSLNLTYVNSIVSLLIRGAYQQVEFPTSIVGANCTLIFQKALPPSTYSYLYFVPAVLVILIFAFLAFLAYWYYSSPLHKLPKEISWSFMDQLLNPWRWNRPCEEYYYREYAVNSPEWIRVETFLCSAFGGDVLFPSKIHAIYNPALTVSFVNSWNVYLTRFKDSPELFFTNTFAKNHQKLWVMEQFDFLCDKFSYNQKLSVPLVPALHGMICFQYHYLLVYL
jgi:cysteine-rich repeat protein